MAWQGKGEGIKCCPQGHEGDKVLRMGVRVTSPW